MPKNLVILLHYFPKKNPKFAALRFGSYLIGEQIYDRLFVKLSRERAKLMHWLEYAGKASSIYEWLLAHDKLI
jgi:hypothetical protein